MEYYNEKGSVAVDTRQTTLHNKDAEHDAHIEGFVVDDLGFTSNDRKDMQRMGKEQELKRNFRLISSVAFTSCVMGTWEILLTTSTPALIAGGSPGLFWSMVWAYVGQTFVVLSLAEMASMAPTAGGQYHWVSEFSPRRYQKVLSYTSGWLSSLSWQAFVVSNCFICASILQAMIALNNPTYDPPRWETSLIVWATAILVSLFNVFGAKHLPLFENIFATFHVLAVFPVIIVLAVLAPKQTSADVFVNFSDNNLPGHQWPNIGLTVLVGQVSAMFTVLGPDSVAHMSEEIKDARKMVPKSMLAAFFGNMPFAFGVLIAFLYSLGNLDDALSSPYPFVYVFQQATGSVAGATGMTVVMYLLLLMITASVFASTSRQTFAFARDGGFPCSRWMSKVSPRFQVPVNSVIVTCLFTVLVSLINIGSTVALNAFLSLGVVGLMATYTISIGCVLLKRLKGEHLPPAHWSLGRYGPAVNSMALVYSVWSFFWSFWPGTYRPMLDTLNWACVIFGGIMVTSAALFVVRGRKVYDGPVVKVEGREIE